jgi:pyruvate dehydrogenase E1 component beta subunit
MAAAIRDTLTTAMADDPCVVVLGDVVGRVGGVAGTTSGLLERFGADRVWDTPIADRAVMGAALGMALGGQRPVVELSSTGRLAAVLEVLRDAAAIATAGEFIAPLVVRIPYGVEAGDRVDQAVMDMLSSCPGVQVVAASGAAEAGGLLRSALASDGPVVLLEPRRLYSVFGDDTGQPMALEAARCVREGKHVTVVGWGASVGTGLAAAERLVREGIDALVVDLVSLVPVDRAAIASWVKETGRLVVVNPTDSSLAGRVLGVGLQDAFLYLESPLSVVQDDPDAAADAARASVAF